MNTISANKSTVNKKWYIIDANGKVLGRVASEAAAILRGKHKTNFTPNVDCGDNVIIINSDKAVLTGDKLTQKNFKTYSGYVGGLKLTPYKTMMAEKSDVAMLRAVKGMLPKNSLGRKMLTHCHVYKDEKHGQEAQKPEVWTLKGDK